MKEMSSCCEGRVQANMPDNVVCEAMEKKEKTIERLDKRLKESAVRIDTALEAIHVLEAVLFKGNPPAFEEKKADEILDAEGLIPKMEQYIDRVNYLTDQIWEHQKFFL